MRYEQMIAYFESDEDITNLLGKLAKDYFDDLFKRAALRDYIKEKEDAQKKEEQVL